MCCCVGNGRFGMFKPNFDKYSIIPLFHPDHPDIVDNKMARFRRNFSDVSKMLKRGSVKPKHGKVHITWREPTWDRLQSSNDDVEKEMDVMRDHEFHKDSVLMCIGGDGLSEMRMEHAIAREPNKWLFATPMVLPIRGEHPHGTAHTLHGGWRLWWKWIEHMVRACDQTEYVKSDWSVSEFKQHDHCMCILMQAVTEFIDEVCKGAPVPPTMVGPFLDALAVNLDAAYLSHFLYDFAFMYWQQRNAVRDGKVRELDLIWRESTAIFNTREGHKTQYAPMNIIHIYRQEALLPEIRAMVDEMRTLSLSGLESSDVGWDMPCEKLNLVLRTTVQLPYKELIQRKIEDYNFTNPVCEAFAAVMHHHRKEKQPQQMRDISRTVAMLKQYLYEKLIYKGTNGPLERAHWEIFLEPSTRSLISAEFNGRKSPWVKAHEAMVPPPHSPNEGYDVFCRRHLDIRVTW
jgi:hypothetical protein